MFLAFVVDFFNQDLSPSLLDEFPEQVLMHKSFGEAVVNSSLDFFNGCPYFE